MINIKYLNQALKHGLKLKKKVHRVIAFEQCYSMKSYIMFNNKVKRMSFEQNSVKFVKSRVFGEAMENIRNHRDMKLEKARRKACQVFNEVCTLTVEQNI